MPVDDLALMAAIRYRRDILRVLKALKHADGDTLAEAVMVRGPIRRSKSYRRSQRFVRTRNVILKGVSKLVEEGLVKHVIITRRHLDWRTNELALTFEGWVEAMGAESEV